MENTEVLSLPRKRSKIAVDTEAEKKDYSVALQSLPKAGPLDPLLRGRAYAAVNEEYWLVRREPPKVRLMSTRRRLKLLKADNVSLEKKGPLVRLPVLPREKLKLVNPLRVKPEDVPRAKIIRHRPRKFLQKDAEVDVRLEEIGLQGSWHRAKVCGVKAGLRQVQFEDLEEEHTGKKLREWVQFGTKSPSGRLPAGTRLITDGKTLLRPAGPGLPPNEPCFRKGGGWPRHLWVEVCESNTWWEGVLDEEATENMIDNGDTFIDIKYPLLRTIVEEVDIRYVRVCKDWNQETGEWTIRGKYND